MTLIVETGAGIANAETYKSEADLVAYATKRGVTLTEAAAAVLLIKAMDRMAGLDYQGCRVNEDQAQDFPRNGVRINGVSYESTTLPKQLGDAQLEYAFAANYVDLSPAVATAAEGQMTRETVGPITTEWAERKGGPSTYAKVPGADRLLQKLLRYTSGSIPIIRA